MSMQITVLGEAFLERAPERGTLHLTVGIESSDKQRAVRETTEVVNRLTAELQRLKQGQNPPVTASVVSALSVYSWKIHDQNGQVSGTQHRAASSVQVTFADFVALSGFVDAWGETEGISIGHVEWTLTDASRTELEREVLAMAVQNAHARATVIARSCGLSTLAYNEVSDPGLLSGQPRAEEMAMPMAMASGRMTKMMDSGGAGAIEIAPQDVRTASTLHVRFAAD